ncbi:hypothetical protein CR513_36755, partial [Mucuna pruriens]
MEAIMRRRFVSSYFHKDLHTKLQCLSQGSKSVDDYHKEMDMAMIRANIVEDQEATMIQFLNGLNRDTADVSIYRASRMVHQEIKVEQQLKRKNSLKNSNSGSFPWKNNSKKEVVGSHSKKNQIEVNPLKNRNIKCFKCFGRGYVFSQYPNKRTMIIKDNGEVKIEEESDNDLMSSLKDDNEELPHKGDLLVVRKVLNMQEKCLVQEKVCSVIIDGGSCTNVASTTLVENLNLQTNKHPRPYKLQWLSDIGKVKLGNQVLVPFAIGKYKDEVLYDVVPMKARHIFLGHPW